MKPLSARYFLLHNKGRAASIIFMISMIALVYVGGLYLTNIKEESIAIVRELKDFVVINNTSGDTNGEQLKAAVSEMMIDPSMEMIHAARNGYQYKTILGFDSGASAYTFEEDGFKQFNKRMHLVPESTPISEHTLLVSEREAASLKVKQGDQLKTSDTEGVQAYWGEGPFDVITYDRNVFSAYFIVNDISESSTYLAIWRDESQKDSFKEKIAEYKARYDMLKFVSCQEQIKTINDDFAINNVIYYSIIAIISIVFAITINAMFIGVYDKRKQEFLIYQGIGIGTHRICRKMICEILLMDVLALLLGGILSVIAVSCLNQLIYYKDGIQMWYYHPIALKATLLCNIAVLIPAIGLRIHKMLHQNRWE